MASDRTQFGAGLSKGVVTRACEHDGYRDIVTRYDRTAGVLTYYWRCEFCGVVLQEVDRVRYRPRFAPLPPVSYFPRRRAPRLSLRVS
jgi:hypothetical protein